jgi:hypothetical protein
MSITTKVKKTGRIFHATTELGRDKTAYRDANGAIQPDTIYEGHLLDAYAYSKNSDVIEYSRAEWGLFRGYELDELHSALSLISAK